AGAEAACADVQPLLLPWDCCGGIKWVMDGPAVDAWQIVFWAQGRGTAFGLAVQVSGIFEERAGLLLDSTRTWWRRHARFWESGMLTGRALPIVPGTSVLTLCSAERDTVIALTTLLHTCPDLLPRLSDPQRMERLAHDLRTGARTNPAPRGVYSRDAT